MKRYIRTNTNTIYSVADELMSAGRVLPAIQDAYEAGEFDIVSDGSSYNITYKGHMPATLLQQIRKAVEYKLGLTYDANL